MTTEEAVLARLGSAFDTIDPVPLAAIEAAVASLSWRDPDTALAELVADSLTAASDVRTRPEAGPRLLTFESDSLTVEVEVADLGETRRLVGQLVPPQRAEVDVHSDTGATRVVADDLGRFTVDSVPGGLVSLVCHLSSPPTRVATSWLAV